MPSIDKIIKLLLALTLSGLVLSQLNGCRKESAANNGTPAAAAKPAEAKAVDGKQVVELQVTGEGYEPSPVRLKKGQPVQLKITRTTDATCATEIVIKDHGIQQPLPLNKTVEVNFTPKESGELKYGCAMDQMISGVFVIE